MMILKVVKIMEIYFSFVVNVVVVVLHVDVDVGVVVGVVSVVGDVVLYCSLSDVDRARNGVEDGGEEVLERAQVVADGPELE